MSYKNYVLGVLLLVSSSIVAQITVGTGFIANNMSEGAPMDNNMAISNAGVILSVDNTRYETYTSAGTMIATIKYYSFYKNKGTPSIVLDTSVYSTFDPKCLYDSYNDRFVLVALVKDTANHNSSLLISFSTTNRPDSTWYHYQIKARDIYGVDTLWIDYPSIAINKNELFLSFQAFSSTSAGGKKNGLLQIKNKMGTMVFRSRNEYTKT